MKANTALGLIEVANIAEGVLVLDEMCKMARINPEVANPISKGKYIIIISGPVGEIESALIKGKEIAGKTLISRFIIRNIHESVVKCLDKRIKPDKIEALGIIETKNALSAVFAADAAAKAASIEMIEIKTGKGIGGKGYFAFTGEVGSVRTAASAAMAAIDSDELISRIVIPQAHGHIKDFV